MNESEFAEMAAAYALNALSPDDAHAFEIARAQHPEWERDAMMDAATAVLLGESVTEVNPPRRIRSALLAQIAVTAQLPADAEPESEPQLSAPAAAPAPARRRFGARGWFALAASLALLVGVGWGAVFVSDQLSTPASVVALNQIQDAPDAQSATTTLPDGGEATAYWSDSVGKSVLVSDGLPTLATDQSYELWFVRDGAPISAGVFTADGGSATALLAGAFQPGDIIAVTVEQAGGSPDGTPTTDPILAIATA